MLSSYYSNVLAGRTAPGRLPDLPDSAAVPQQQPAGCNGLVDVLQSLLGSGVEAGCFFAANAVALTAVARGGKGALVGWEPREPAGPESYWDGVRGDASASAMVAAPMALALLLSRCLVGPLAGVLGKTLSGRRGTEPVPAATLFPAPSRRAPDGRLRTRAELSDAWRKVRQGRKAVLARQARFAPGGIRDLACELAHPLAFALQGVALDFRADRPGLLTVGGITLATAGLATGLAETILDALKASATVEGIDENGRAAALNLFERGDAFAGSTLVDRLRSMPAALRKAMYAEYQALTGGADGGRRRVMALAAELARAVAAVLVLNGVTALIDPLDAQFGRSSEKSRDVAANAGFTLLSVAVATTCFRLALKLLIRQHDGRSARREPAAVDSAGGRNDCSVYSIPVRPDRVVLPAPRRV